MKEKFLLFGILLIGLKAQSQTIVNDTVCQNSLVNGLCLGGDITKMYIIFGNPITEIEIESREEEHSKPAQRIYN